MLRCKLFSNSQQVDPVCNYTYDPLYRLTERRGENISVNRLSSSPRRTATIGTIPSSARPQANDLQALRNYTEHYDYDPVGNFNRMIHQAGNGNWTRAYTYDEPSLIEACQRRAIG